MFSGLFAKIGRSKWNSRIALALQGFGQFWVEFGRNVELIRLRTERWWTHKDRQLSWWRTANYVALGAILATIIIPALEIVRVHELYRLQADTLELTGKADPKLAGQLKYDKAKQIYQFNKDAAAQKNQAPGQMTSAVGSPEAGKSLYGVDVPKDMSRGVTYHDANLKLSFNLKPEFAAMDGRQRDGRVVYPLKAGGQAVYTLKNNGLKEDIVLQSAPANRMRFNYSLDLPRELEARLLEDGSGGVGVYSGDPALFGDITYGSEDDRVRMTNARTRAEKNYLVFGLPAPVIKAAGPKGIGEAKARFELNGNTLSVIADDLKTIDGAFTIDPSVVVTSTSDFGNGGNNETGISFGTANQVTRGGLTGGTMGTWASTGNGYYAACAGVGTAVYNGYLYAAGCGGGDSRVRYAALNSDGTLANWSSTTSMNTSRGYLKVQAYNGYLYAIGGVDGVPNYYNTVEYAPIAANGTVGTWTATSSFTTGRSAFASAVYNGYLYIMGGYDGSNVKNDVQYVAIKANGALGTWASTSSFTTTRSSLGGFAHNGYLYIAGGYNAVSTYYSDTQYAKINSDGTVGTWAATTSFTTARAGLAMTVHRGYAYIMGGTTNGTSALNDTQYAQILGNGTLGPWSTSSTLNTGVWSGAGAAYNGYLYIVNGQTGSASWVSSTQYAAIDSPGKPQSFTTSGNTFTTTRQGGQTIAYHGYLYVMGGDNGGTPVNTIYYASINASTGDVGSFSSTTAFTTNRTFFAAVAYDGYMYVLGGCSSAFSSCTTAGNNLATVYSASVNADGTLNSWSAQTSFTTARYGLRAVAYNGYMYVMGGLNGSTFQNDIQYHAMSSGTISGAWTTSSNTISTARAYFGATVAGGTLYIVGGCSAGALTCTTARSDIQYAALATSGDLSASLTSNGTSITNARGGLGLVAMRGYLYVIGGWDGSTYYSDSQYAPINANGSVGSWTAGNNIATARWGIGAVEAKGNLYVTGGYNGTTYYNNVQYASVNNGGSGESGTWTTVGNNLGLEGAWFTGTTVYNGVAYAVGGYNTGVDYVTSTSYAALSDGGAMANWTSTSSLGTKRGWITPVAVNGYLYASMGYNGSPVSTTEKAAINANGTLGSWSNTTATPGDTRDSFAATAYNGRIYIIGGDDGAVSSRIDYATPAASGDITSWTQTTSLPVAASEIYATAYNGYLYVSLNSQIAYVVINSDGTLGSTWAYAEGPELVTSAPLTPHNGFMYTVYDNSGGADMQYAPIMANGKLGAWQESGSTLNGRTQYVYRGYLYSIDPNVTGNSGSASAPLDVIPRTSTYSKLVDFGGTMSITGISYNGTLPTDSSSNSAANISYKAAGSNGVFGSSALASTITAGSTCAVSNLTDKRYVQVNITIDDTSVASFPDSVGTPANVTDFTVSSTAVHPASNIRMRTGRTLQTGNLSTYDTCT